MKPVLRISRKDYSRATLLLVLLMFAIRIAPAAIPSPTTESKTPLPNALVLRGGTIFDSRRALMLSDQTIIIRGDRIDKVGPRRSFARIPRNTRVLDARGKFIIPGLIDAHVHLVHQLNDAHLTGDAVLPMFLAAGVTTIRDAGVPILAGTDTPEPYVPPGFSLLQELELLVEAGLSPGAALQAATINNAATLKQESQLGSIEPGKLADLVILSADPTADIRNVRRIQKVIRGGRISEPEELLKLVPLQ